MKSNSDFLEYKHFFESAFNFFNNQNIKEVYIVGGFIRDLLTNVKQSLNDIDFIVKGDTQKISKDFSSIFGGEVKAYPSFFTAKVTFPREFKIIKEIDFASMREEEYEKGGAFPKAKITNSLDVDLKRRDFTINTLVVLLSDFLKIFNDEKQGVNSELLKNLCIDKFNALSDLDNKIIRVLHDKSFYDDPTRIFRAFKYKERIGGKFDKHTKDLISKALNDGVLKTISKGRIQKEIEKIKREVNFNKILDELSQFGVFFKEN